MDQKLAEDSICIASNQDGSKPTVSLICATNKHQKMVMRFGGAERNNPEPELRHKNDTANGQDLPMDEQTSRPVGPLPSRFLPFADPVNLSPNHSHPRPGYQSLTPLCYHSNKLPCHYPPHRAGSSLGDMSSTLRGDGPNCRKTASATYFDALLPSNAYSSVEIANSVSDPTASLMDLNYTPPGAYSGVNAIVNAPRCDIGAAHNTGWLGTSQVVTSTPVSTYYNGPAYSSSSYPMAAVTHHFNSAYPINFTYSPHSAVATSPVLEPGYPSPFPSYGGGSYTPQQHWNHPVAHHNPSYNSPSFPPPSFAHYPPHLTLHAQNHLPFSVHTPQGYPPMLTFNGGGPLVSCQPWNTPANYPQ
ncbi:hypothetical protein PM082_006267 [Marasmius tenuissimus]|nr:hypothetical protein PM082_006267 [Marasmius tenuissimus]